MEHINPCLKKCGECKYQSECPGCRYNCEHELCDIAKCCRDRGHSTCETCTDRTFCPTLRSAPMMYKHRKEKFEAQETAAQKRRENSAVMLKWLKPMFAVLVIAEVVGLFTGTFSDFLAPAALAVFNLASAAIQLLHAYFLGRMKPVCVRYGDAAKFLMISALLSAVLIPVKLVGGIAVTVVGIVTGIAGLAVNIRAVYSEYHAHSDAIVDFDPYLAEGWEKLWKWQIGTMAVIFGGTVLVPMLGILMLLLMLAASVASLIIEIVELVYIRRMISQFEWNTEADG